MLDWRGSGGCPPAPNPIPTGSCRSGARRKVSISHRTADRAGNRQGSLPGRSSLRRLGRWMERSNEKEECRDMRHMNFIDDSGADLRYAGGSRAAIQVFATPRRSDYGLASGRTRPSSASCTPRYSRRCHFQTRTLVRVSPMVGDSKAERRRPSSRVERTRQHRSSLSRAFWPVARSI